LYRWVVHNVRSAPLPGDTARDVFLRGEGDRSLLLAHLARQAGLEAELWYASPASRGTPAAGLWLDGDYAVPLVRLDGQWLYAEENAVPFGALPPNVAGRPAARVSPAWGEEAVAAVEDPPSEFRLEAFAGPEGGVEVEAEARLFGLAATAMRQALEEEGEGEQPEELVRVYALPAFARDASITVVAVENADDVEAPLVVRAHVRLHAGPRGRPELSVRHRWQDRFALMVQRTQPLLLPVSVREEWTIVAQVAAGAEAAVLPLEIEMPFGTFRQWLERSAAAGTLVVRRSLRLPAQRIVPADYESFRSFAAAVDAATEPSVSLVASPGTR
jgi:hypothetical protein